MQKQVINFLEYIIVLLLILISANPFVSYNKVLFLSIIFFILIIRIRNRIFLLFEINWKNFLIIFFVFGYEMVHATIFDNFKLLNTFRITMTMYIAFLIIKIINIRFIKIYSNIIFYLAIISLLMYPIMYTNFRPALMKFAENIFYMPPSELGYNVPTLVFYTFDNTFIKVSNNLYRNAGFAWEAGAFVIYLNIALIFKLFIDRQSKSFLNKFIIVYVISIITTFSTTGYLVTFLIILIFVLNSQSDKIFKWVFLLIFIPASLSIYHKADFLKEKINNQYIAANESRNRFGSALLDLNDVMKRPFFGWSRDQKILFGKEVTLDAHRPNGVTNLLRSYGFIYFIFFFSLIYISFRKLGNLTVFFKPSLFGAFFLLVIMISAFSQLVFDNMFFRSMVFWGDAMLMSSVFRVDYRNLKFGWLSYSK